MSLPAIEVESLAKSYVLNRGRGETEDKTVWVLNDISFKAEPGDVIGIIGKNGAGKSTLLKILARITEPTKGRAIIRGRVASLLEVGTGFHDELSGRENVFMNGTLLGMTPTEVRKRFDEIVAFSGVERYIDQPVKHYSSGMRVRLAFSVAAHLDPEVMFIDEVLSVGDMEFQDRCLKRMNQLTTEFGRTVLFVSHNMNAVATLCPRALLLNQGKCVALGPTGEVIKQYHALVHGRKDKKELAEREDRTGAGGVRFQEVQLQDGNGQKIEFARSGMPLRMALHYRFDDGTPLGDRVNVNVAFNNARGQRLFATPADLVTSIPGKIDRDGWCYLDIPKLALMPGRYEIDLAFQIDRLTVDKVSGAAVLPVVEGPFYPSGRLPNSLSGDLLVDYSWSFDKDGRPPASLHSSQPVQDVRPRQGIKSQLVALAPAVNALEASSREVEREADPERHQELLRAFEDHEAKVAALRAQISADDEDAARVAAQFDKVLARIRSNLAKEDGPPQLHALAPALNELETASRELAGSDQAVDRAGYGDLLGRLDELAAMVAELKASLPEEQRAGGMAAQLDAALARTRLNLADAELPMLLGVPVPAQIEDRGIGADDPRLARRDSVSASIAELARPAAALGSFVNQALEKWDDLEDARKVADIVAARAKGLLHHAGALLASAADDPAARKVHEQMSRRLEDIVHQAEFMAAAEPGIARRELRRAWQRVSVAKALRAPDDVKDPADKPILNRLAVLAGPLNALEASVGLMVRQTTPVELGQYRKLRNWTETFRARVGTLKAEIGDDAAATDVAGKLDAVLARTSYALGEIEIAVLLGLLPGTDPSWDMIADSTQAVRDTAAASMAEYGRPATTLADFADHALETWTGSPPQREAMRIVGSRAGTFLKQADDLLAANPDDAAVRDIHWQVSLRLKDVIDWATYLEAAPADAGSGAEELFRAWQANSRVRELHLSEIFAGIEQVSVPIGAINQESAHENQVDLLYVSAIARAIQAKRVFEVGTYMGRTTWHLAQTSPDTQVWTLNLPPEADPRIAPVLGSYYRGTPEAARIHELWTDSQTFDPGQLAGTMDLVFVDADHSYPAVVADTKRALQLVRPGGVVIWHDYASKSPGVVRFAHDFARTSSLFRIKHTCLLCLIEGVDAFTFAPASMRRGIGD